MTVLAIATFAEEGPFVRARTRALAADHRIIGEWTPYSSEALATPDGTKGILPAAIATGVAGAVALFALESWSAIQAYPFNTGARPLFSWPAFIPAPIEVGALTAALGALALFFRRASLTRLHHPAFDFPEVAQATQGAFVLMLACDEGQDANAALALLASTGATHSRLVTR